MARVHVAAVQVGRDRRERPGRRRHAELAAERGERQGDARPELGPAAGRVVAGDLVEAIREVIGQEPEAGNRGGPAPIGRLELEQVELERVAWLGALDLDRAVDLVDAREVEIRQRLGGRIGGQLPVRGVEAVELDDVAGRDSGDRRNRRIPCQVVLLARDVDRGCRHRHLGRDCRTPENPGSCQLLGLDRRTARRRSVRQSGWQPDRRAAESDPNSSPAVVAPTDWHPRVRAAYTQGRRIGSSALSSSPRMRSAPARRVCTKAAPDEPQRPADVRVRRHHRLRPVEHAQHLDQSRHPEQRQRHPWTDEPDQRRPDHDRVEDDHQHLRHPPGERLAQDDG